MNESTEPSKELQPKEIINLPEKVELLKDKIKWSQKGPFLIALINETEVGIHVGMNKRLKGVDAHNNPIVENISV